MTAVPGGGLGCSCDTAVKVRVSDSGRVSDEEKHDSECSSQKSSLAYRKLPKEEVFEFRFGVSSLIRQRVGVADRAQLVGRAQFVPAYRPMP